MYFLITDGAASMFFISTFWTIFFFEYVINMTKMNNLLKFDKRYRSEFLKSVSIIVFKTGLCTILIYTPSEFVNK